MRVVRIVPVRRRISIARGNSPTTSIRCAGVWTKEARLATDSKKATSRGNSKASSKAINKVNNLVRRVNKARKDNADSKAARKVNSKVSSKVESNRAEGKAAVRDKPATNNVLALIGQQ